MLIFSIYALRNQRYIKKSDEESTKNDIETNFCKAHVRIYLKTTQKTTYCTGLHVDIQHDNNTYFGIIES